jgi:acyl-CoA reductase-like NAD-dependent aldehyde dehydrogenase
MSSLQSINARTGEPHGRLLAACTPEEIDAAVTQAAAAADAWVGSTPIKPARLVRSRAGAFGKDAEALIAWADLQTEIGDAAHDRFLHPISLQDPPAWLRARRGRPC